MSYSIKVPLCNEHIHLSSQSFPWLTGRAVEFFSSLINTIPRQVFSSYAVIIFLTFVCLNITNLLALKNTRCPDVKLELMANSQLIADLSSVIWTLTSSGPPMSPPCYAFSQPPTRGGLTTRTAVWGKNCENDGNSNMTQSVFHCLVKSVGITSQNVAVKLMNYSMRLSSQLETVACSNVVFYFLPWKSLWQDSEKIFDKSGNSLTVGWEGVLETSVFVRQPCVCDRRRKRRWWWWWLTYHSNQKS